LDWKETIPASARILHPLRQDAKVLDSDGNIVTKPLSPYVIGLYVRRDALTGGVPTKSAANQAMYGLVGVTPTIPFSIVDANSLGQTDLEDSFGIVFRGDVGADGSLSDGGYTFWGTDTLSADTQWLFANVTRMRDYLELLQVKALRVYLGNYNLTRQTIQAIINTMETQLVNLRANGYILDYAIGFDPAVNTPEELELGHIDLQFEAEEPPVLRKITIHSRRHAEALVDLARSIAISLGADIQQ
jgi:phage tail sheath protein FI